MIDATKYFARFQSWRIDDNIVDATKAELDRQKENLNILCPTELCLNFLSCILLVETSYKLSSWKTSRKTLFIASNYAESSFKDRLSILSIKDLLVDQV
jgi:hypothetical protein